MLFSDIIRYAIAVLAVAGTGLAIGFRPDGGVVGLILGMFLVILFAFNMKHRESELTLFFPLFCEKEGKSLVK